MKEISRISPLSECTRQLKSSLFYADFVSELTFVGIPTSDELVMEESNEAKKPIKQTIEKLGLTSNCQFEGSVYYYSNVN
ncbi:hypothetical protein GCM10010917_41500 [Paenibacillus physcomitrellae]|uniref:Uncharacterized protein n=1 Tax=Paenibacillus physcomitrellae TaxID=1619311 RepID=A0ABQ1GWZ3_9BACL|nr:hypothetical protein GCM10010917_41500 [Paenibacillus physcomitrellae]